MTKGFLTLVLHAHLPYVHHPEHARFFEENWLFEAITECYLPLLGVLERLERDQVNYRLTLSLSPTLLSLLSSPLLQSRYCQQLQRQQQLAEREITRTRSNPELHALAQYYYDGFTQALFRYQHVYQQDLLSAFKHHHSTGHLALITTAATHGFLPLLNVSECAVRNQINLGIATFEQQLGITPTGFWLPECGYYPGVEQLLQAAGIDHFFVEAHGLLQANPVAERGVYAPINCGNGVAVFARDPESSEQVWSQRVGYPGDAAYREYYRDIGFELEEAFLAPYLIDGHLRYNTGIKYHRVTGATADKALYDPELASAKARQHAADFIQKRQQQLAALPQDTASPPILVAPYDAELFGHWWFEGPQWLEAVLRLASAEQSEISLCSASEYLQHASAPQIALPAASSWGEQGYASMWLNDSNAWIYPFLHTAQTELEKLTHDLTTVSLTPLQTRAINQAFRSLLLAQASDWPFIMKSGTAVSYAEKSITDHLARFNYCLDSLRKNQLDERYITALEIMDAIFPDLDFRAYFS